MAWVRRYGLLTEKQYLVLKLRFSGMTQDEVSRVLGTTRENVAIIERRARERVALALETVRIFKEMLSVKTVVVEAGTHLINVPSIVVDAANQAGVKLRANFTRLYDEIRYKARGCIEGVRVVKPVKILILRSGDFEVIPYGDTLKDVLRVRPSLRRKPSRQPQHDVVGPDHGGPPNPATPENP
ncbi:MAG: transcriptional regulator [Desulfurococcales archaeon ex4484_204]|nr:MAG: transcriptional regulator [Desulfurococcales archaeon ex4484_204]